MGWWIYLGKVTTPVAGGVLATIDERGNKPIIVPRDPNVSTVLVPRLKFEAPTSSVAHLVRLKRVAPLKPHQIPRKIEEKKAEINIEDKVQDKIVELKEPILKKKEEKSSTKEKLVVASEIIDDKKEVSDQTKNIDKKKEKLEKKEGGSKRTKRRG